MKTKSFLMFSTSVFATSLFLLIFHTQQPDSIQNIVSNTHRHIKDFQPSSTQENLRDVESSHLVQEEKYYHLLGVDGSLEQWHNTTVPAIVTYGYGDSHASAVSFVRAAAKLPYTVLLYDLGFTTHSLGVVSNFCNSTKCMVLEFDTNPFPSHVSDLRIHAFRPLIIQHALSRVGAVIYADPLYHWAGSPSDLLELWSKVSSTHGILTWPRRPAVTSLTHPRMFHYFHADVDDFLFVQMVDASRLMVDRKLMADVMKNWIQCALTLECIMPIGAQSVGCRFDKKPQYRYSGCHGQDSSALSIVLGRAFHFEEHHYTYRGHRLYWRKYTESEVREEYQMLERNSTETDSKTDLTDVETVKGVT